MQKEASNIMEQNKTETSIPYLRTLRKWTPVLPILGIVIALALSVGLVMDFDEDIGHFAIGSPSFYLMTAGTAAAALIAAVFGKCATQKFSLTSCPETAPLSVCASYFTALMAIITAAAFFYDTFLLNRIATPLELMSNGTLFALPVSMLLGAHETTRHSTVRVIFAILAALSVNLNMFACYFDFTLPLNSAVRNLITIAQAGAMLILLSEVRLALSPERRATAPFLVFSSVFGASAVFGISFGLCVFAFVSPDAIDMGISVYRFASYFGIALLALSRLFALTTAAGPYIPSEEDAPEAAKEPSGNSL